MTDIETLVHRADGTLELDRPWFCKIGQKIKIGPSDLSGAGKYAENTEATIDEASSKFNLEKLQAMQGKHISEQCPETLVIRFTDYTGAHHHAYVRGCTPID